MQTHLKGFGLENFRVFKDYTWFDFAPITILTGPNSSGKSSLNKALLLMKDSLKAKRELFSSVVKYPLGVRIPLNFEGPLHNLSSDNNSISKDSLNPFISFFFKNPAIFSDLPIIKRIGYLVLQRAVQLESDKNRLQNAINVRNFTELLDSECRPFIRILRGRTPSFFCDLTIMTEIARQFLYKSDLIIGKNLKMYEAYSRHFDGSLDPNYIWLSEMKKCLEDFINNFSNLKFDYHQVNLLEFYQEHAPFFQENIFQQVNFEPELSERDFKNLFSWKVEVQFGFLLVKNGYRSGFDKTDANNLFPQDSNISILINNFVLTLSILTGTFETSKGPVKSPEILLPELGDLHYLPSIKGFNERSFRSKDENVLNLLFKQYKNYGIDEVLGTRESRRVFFDRWFSEFGLKNMKMERHDTLDVNSFTVNGFSNVDIGYGMTQIIAVMLRILSVADSVEDHTHNLKPTIVILEEPEANLHPKYQSMLADLFVEAAETFNIQFIIETHSEYLIRKMQYLTAKKQVKPEDTVIYYFHDPNNIPKDEKQVKKIQILEDGSLSDDFGPGFFDEAANWELELIRLKNNKNRNN